MLSICGEFLSNSQRVLVDGATSEWIPIVSGVTPGSVFYPPQVIIYTAKRLSWSAGNEQAPSSGRCSVCWQLLALPKHGLVLDSGMVQSQVHDT